jgi:hypothetical protein
MLTQQPAGQIRKLVRGIAHLWAGLVMALLLTSCGQTTEIGNPHSAQTSAQTQAGDADQLIRQQPQGRQFPYAKSDVLVKFSSETEAQVIAQIQKELHLETIRKFSSPNLYLMRITDGSSVEKMIERLNGYESVEYAEPNYEVKINQ